MYQIDNSTAAVSQPAATAAGSAGYFTDGNPATSTPATIVPAEWLNAVMMELANVVTGAGLTLSKPTYNQVLSSIKRLVQNQVVLTDTGSANAYAAANLPALVAGTWTNGVTQQIKITNANTGTSTYAPDGLTAIPIYGIGLQPLQGGELYAGGTAILMKQTIAGVNSGNPIAVLLECTGAALQVAPATQSQHAMQLGQATGRLLRTTVYARVGGVQQVSVNGGAFTSTGASTHTLLSATQTAIGEVQAAGGAGAGAGGAGAGNVSMGAPGGSGSYGKSIWTAAAFGASQAITVGAGGAAASNAAGGNGGSSSIGSLLTTPGGLGGGLSNNVPPPSQNGNGSFTTAPTGANVVTVRGGSTQATFGLSASTGIGGTGGSSMFGVGATGPGINTNGISAINYGTGGSGIVLNQSGGMGTGGAGGDGIVIIQEFA